MTLEIPPIAVAYNPTPHGSIDNILLVPYTTARAYQLTPDEAEALAQRLTDAAKAIRHRHHQEETQQ